MVSPLIVVGIYELLDIAGLVAPCHLRPHYGNPLARLEADLRIDAAKRARLLAEIRERVGLFRHLTPSTLTAAVTVADVAALLGRR